jgi:hypothetical protein
VVEALVVTVCRTAVVACRLVVASVRGTWVCEVKAWIGNENVMVLPATPLPETSVGLTRVLPVPVVWTDDVVPVPVPISDAEDVPPFRRLVVGTVTVAKTVSVIVLEALVVVTSVVMVCTDSETQSSLPILSVAIDRLACPPVITPWLHDAGKPAHCLNELVRVLCGVIWRVCLTISRLHFRLALPLGR